MKRFYLLCSVMMLFIISLSSAQLLQQFKARDGKATATSTAVAAIPNSKLMAVATMTGSYDFNGMPVTISFDEAKGTSLAWLYFFHSTSPDSSIVIGVAKLALGGLTAIPINPSQFGVQFPFQPVSPLENYWWMNSDSMMLMIGANANFKAYKSANTDQKLKMTAIAVEPLQNESIWGAVFEAKAGKLNCMVNALSGATQCIELTDIADNNNSGIVLYPNPVNDLAILNIRTESGVNKLNIQIYNIQGQLVRSIDNPSLDATGSMALDFSSFRSGSYFIRLEINGIYKTYPFVINK